MGYSITKSTIYIRDNMHDIPNDTTLSIAKNPLSRNVIKHYLKNKKILIICISIAIFNYNDHESHCETKEESKQSNMTDLIWIVSI